MDRRVKAAVVGVGFFGERHVRVYSELPNAQLVAVVDADISRAREIAARYGCEVETDVASLVGKIDVASIVTPTASHVKTAIPLLNAGIDLLIEKPITATLTEADEIIELAREKKRIVQVGHIERYNPALLQLKKYVTSPRVIECHRMGPFVERAANVSVILDLMIHDIDIVLSMTKCAPIKVEAAGISVVSPETDIAHARLFFADGMVASLLASRASEERIRTLRLFQDQGYFSLNYLTRELTVFQERQRGDALPSRLNDVTKGLGKDSHCPSQKYVFEQADMLKAEINAFIEAVMTRQVPAVSAVTGRAALAVALQIIDALNAPTIQ